MQSLIVKIIEPTLSQKASDRMGGVGRGGEMGWGWTWGAKDSNSESCITGG